MRSETTPNLASGAVDGVPRTEDLHEMISMSYEQTVQCMTTLALFIQFANKFIPEYLCSFLVYVP